MAAAMPRYSLPNVSRAAISGAGRDNNSCDALGVLEFRVSFFFLCLLAYACSRRSIPSEIYLTCAIFCQYLILVNHILCVCFSL